MKHFFKILLVMSKILNRCLQFFIYFLYKKQFAQLFLVWLIIPLPIFGISRGKICLYLYFYSALYSKYAAIRKGIKIKAFQCTNWSYFGFYLSFLSAICYFLFSILFQSKFSLISGYSALVYSAFLRYILTNIAKQFNSKRFVNYYPNFT